MKNILLALLVACGDNLSAPPDAANAYSCTASLTCDDIVYQDTVLLCGSNVESNAWLGDWLTGCFFIAEQAGCSSWSCRDECVSITIDRECHNQQSPWDARMN